MSMSKTRLSSLAQLMRTLRLSVIACGSVACSTGLGMISLRFAFGASTPCLIVVSGLVSHDPHQLSQPISRQNHPSVSNSARTNNVSHREHRNRLNLSAVLVCLRAPNPPTVTVSDLRRNLKALFCPRLKDSDRKFGPANPTRLPAMPHPANRGQGKRSWTTGKEPQ